MNGDLTKYIDEATTKLEAVKGLLDELAKTILKKRFVDMTENELDILWETVSAAANDMLIEEAEKSDGNS